MTYAGFLLVFLVGPLLLSVWWCRAALARGGWRPLLWVLPVVYVAAGLWDRAAVAAGLWSFDRERIWGIDVAGLPLEEWLFYGLQAGLTGVWVLHGMARR